ncbi:MAG TPA: hypothetical protein DIU15_01255, partial [Deltaproteobacteria bacterium]|nr:hypothetical protein [Deltaproteobacteria bacterium]
MQTVLIRLLVALGILVMASCFGPGLQDDPTGMYSDEPGEASMDDDDDGLDSGTDEDSGEDDDSAGDD